MPQGYCRLCGNSDDLQLSHILPAFVFRWMRDSSGSGHIRMASAPNQRVQDGLKRHWLCIACESLFSRSESAFATQLFHPYTIASGGRFRYTSWLLYFCVSVSWRVLRFYRDEIGLKDWTPEALARVSEAEGVWREFLLGRRPHPGAFRQHLLPMDRVQSATGPLANNINRYFMRAVDMDICRGNESIFVYAKIGRFIIMGFIQERNPTRWRGTKVHGTAGVIEPRKYVLPHAFGEYLNDKATRMSRALARVSDRQQQKIDGALRANADKFVGSDAFAAMQADIEMFGHEAFTKRESPPNDGC